jgi:hypothetical protein
MLAPQLGQLKAVPSVTVPHQAQVLLRAGAAGPDGPLGVIEG